MHLIFNNELEKNDGRCYKGTGMLPQLTTCLFHMLMIQIPNIPLTTGSGVGDNTSLLSSSGGITSFSDVLFKRYLQDMAESYYSLISECVEELISVLPTLDALQKRGKTTLMFVMLIIYPGVYYLSLGHLVMRMPGI